MVYDSVASLCKKLSCSPEYASTARVEVGVFVHNSRTCVCVCVCVCRWMADWALWRDDDKVPVSSNCSVIFNTCCLAFHLLTVFSCHVICMHKYFLSSSYLSKYIRRKFHFQEVKCGQWQWLNTLASPHTSRCEKAVLWSCSGKSELQIVVIIRKSGIQDSVTTGHAGFANFVPLG